MKMLNFFLIKRLESMNNFFQLDSLSPSLKRTLNIFSTLIWIANYVNKIRVGTKKKLYLTTLWKWPPSRLIKNTFFN